MSQNSSASILRNYLAGRGYTYYDYCIPDANCPALVAVTANKRTTCIDTANHGVYTMDPIANCEPTNMTQNTSPGRNTNIGGNNNPNMNANPNTSANPRSTSGSFSQGNPASSSNNGNYRDSGILPCSSYSTNPASQDINAMDLDSGSNSQSSNYCPPGWICKKNLNVRGGIHILTRNDIVPDPQQHTPTLFNADLHFHDGLYMSLQEDMRPKGANPLDDYLNDRRDTRMRMYLNAAIDNQGCGCEHTDLDRYLNQNKDNVTTMSLRATLSDEYRKRVYQPADTKAISNKIEAMKGQVESWVNFLREASEKQLPDRVNPWTSYNEGQDSTQFDPKSI